MERAATGSGQRVDVSYCCSVTILALAPTPDQTQTPSRGASVCRHVRLKIIRIGLHEQQWNGIVRIVRILN